MKRGLKGFAFLVSGLVLGIIGATVSATAIALRGGGLNDQLRIVDGDGGENDAGVGSLGVVDVGNKVGIALGEVLGNDLAAELLKGLREVVDQALIVVAAEHTEQVSGVNAELLVGIVRENRALERIEEADAEINVAP